jgi:hypothetical protein
MVEIVSLARFGRPSNADSTRHETRYQVVDNLSLSRSHSEWKGGVTVNHVSLDSELRDGFGAIYIFRTLDDFAAARPAMRGALLSLTQQRPLWAGYCPHPGKPPTRNVPK